MPDDPDTAETSSSAIRSTPWYVPETPGRNEAQDSGRWSAASRYVDDDVDDGPIAQDPATKSVEPHDIARDLDLAACTGIDGLNERRRRFAQENHPDRMPPSLCANATERMMIANRLVDLEIARRRGSSSQ